MRTILFLYNINGKYQSIYISDDISVGLVKKFMQVAFYYKQMYSLIHFL